MKKPLSYIDRTVSRILVHLNFYPYLSHVKNVALKIIKCYCYFKLNLSDFHSLVLQNQNTGFSNETSRTDKLKLAAGELKSWEIQTTAVN